MKLKYGLVLIVSLAVFYGVAASDGGADAAEQNYYTEQQVDRGAGLYAQHCASCHGNSLQGSASAPPLVGLPFLSYWSGRDALELFEYTAESMPLDRPGSLSDQNYADLVAVILHANEFPGGEQEFPSEKELMLEYPLTVD